MQEQDQHPTITKLTIKRNVSIGLGALLSLAASVAIWASFAVQEDPVRTYHAGLILALMAAIALALATAIDGQLDNAVVATHHTGQADDQSGALEKLQAALKERDAQLYDRMDILFGQMSRVSLQIAEAERDMKQEVASLAQREVLVLEGVSDLRTTLDDEVAKRRGLKQGLGSPG